MTSEPPESTDTDEDPSSGPLPAGAAQDTQSPTKPARAESTARPGRLFRETALLLVVAIVLAVVVKTLFVQAFYIPSASMQPGLVKNDRILVEKPSYWFNGTPQRGDIVVFADPGDWLTAEEKTGPTGAVATTLSKIGLYPTGGHLVKRVIGIGGDTIHCCTAQGELEVNGKAINENKFIVPQPKPSCDGPMAGCQGWTATVPKGRLFVMGDNRDNSADSSYHLCRSGAGSSCNPEDAYIPTSLVVGKVFALVFPFGRFRVFHRPAVFSTIPSPAAG